MLPSTIRSGKLRKISRKKSTASDLLRTLHEISTSSHAPSIPSRDQSYGYEPTQSGKLILQPSTYERFKGTKDDKVGPGDYNPSSSFVLKKEPSTTFSVSFMYL